MAGYWPSSFFCKKRTRPISSHFDRTNLVNKGFIIWLLGKFCLRDTAGSSERARWLHLARSGSQSQRVIWFILPARGASHIINIDYFIESATYGFLFTSCKTLENSLVRCAHSFVFQLVNKNPYVALSMKYSIYTVKLKI